MTGADYARIICRTAVVAICCLLALATSASAECAWVLWVDAWYRESGGRNGWSPNDTFERKVDCLTRLDAEFAKNPPKKNLGGKAGGSFSIRRGEEVAVLYYPPGDGNQVATVVWTYRCLPDTVDPRGPKGTRQ